MNCGTKLIVLFCILKMTLGLCKVGQYYDIVLLQYFYNRLVNPADNKNINCFDQRI